MKPRLRTSAEKEIKLKGIDEGLVNLRNSLKKDRDSLKDSSGSRFKQISTQTENRVSQRAAERKKLFDFKSLKSAVEVQTTEDFSLIQKLRFGMRVKAKPGSKAKVDSSRVTINLNELISQNHSQKQAIQAERRIKEKAERRKRDQIELRKFLSRGDLQHLADDFIQLGFQDVQTLLQVKRETLNSMRLKAHLQIKLQKIIIQHKQASQSQSFKKQKQSLPTQLSMNKSMSFLNQGEFNSQLVRCQTTVRLLDQEEQYRPATSKSLLFFTTLGDQHWKLPKQEFQVQSKTKKVCKVCFNYFYQNDEEDFCSKGCQKQAKTNFRLCQSCQKDIGKYPILQQGKWFCSELCVNKQSQAISQLEQGLQRIKSVGQVQQDVDLQFSMPRSSSTGRMLTR